MEYKGDEQPSLNNARQLHSPEHTTVPASLLPSVLSRLGLGDTAGFSSTGTDNSLAALKDEEIPVRVAAVRSLGKQREASAIEPLVDALHDSAWEVRAAAVWALGEFGEQAPLEALVRATDDEDGSVRAAALRTLGLWGDRAPIEPMMQALNDPDWQVREIVALTVEERGMQAPLEPLAASLNDEYAGVREAARMALEQFSALVRTFLSKMVSDMVTPLGDRRSTLDDGDMSSALDDEPANPGPRQRSAQTRPRHLGRIAEGALAALIIAGIVASWLVIEHRLHPSQGSASSALLTYHGPVNGPAVWSSDSKSVTIVTNASPAGETVLVWNRDTGQMTKHVLHAPGAHPQENRTVFAPDGKHFALLTRDTNDEVAVQVWDAIAWRSILLTYYSSPSGYLDISWSPDSARIVITGEDGAMQVWNVTTGHELVTCHVPAEEYQSVYISPDGLHAIIGSTRQYNYVLDLTTCKLLTFPSTHSFSTYWSPRGNRFATISPDASMVQVWDVQTGHDLASFHLANSVSTIIWTPDGTRIIIEGDKEVEVVDVATRRIVLQVIPAGSILQPVWASSPDGTRIASLSRTNTVQIWDAVTGHSLNVYQSHGKRVNVMVWSPDFYSHAIGTIDGKVEIWRGDTAPEIYQGNSSLVWNLAWSPDGKSIAAGGLDGSLSVWEVK